MLYHFVGFCFFDTQVYSFSLLIYKAHIVAYRNLLIFVGVFWLMELLCIQDHCKSKVIFYS